MGTLFELTTMNIGSGLSSPDFGRLTFHEGGHQRDFPITKQKITIGREKTCDLVISRREVSRRHVQLESIDNVMWISSLGKEPVSVNGVPITEPKELFNGDNIEIQLENKVKVITFECDEETIQINKGVPNKIPQRLPFGAMNTNQRLPPTAACLPAVKRPELPRRNGNDENQREGIPKPQRGKGPPPPPPPPLPSAAQLLAQKANLKPAGPAPPKEGQANGKLPLQLGNVAFIPTPADLQSKIAGLRKTRQQSRQELPGSAGKPAAREKPAPETPRLPPALRDPQVAASSAKRRKSVRFALPDEGKSPEGVPKDATITTDLMAGAPALDIVNVNADTTAALAQWAMGQEVDGEAALPPSRVLGTPSTRATSRLRPRTRTPKASQQERVRQKRASRSGSINGTPAVLPLSKAQDPTLELDIQDSSDCKKQTPPEHAPSSPLLPKALQISEPSPIGPTAPQDLQPLPLSPAAALQSAPDSSALDAVTAEIPEPSPLAPMPINTQSKTEVAALLEEPAVESLLMASLPDNSKGTQEAVAAAGEAMEVEEQCKEGVPYLDAEDGHQMLPEVVGLPEELAAPPTELSGGFLKAPATTPAGLAGEQLPLQDAHGTIGDGVHTPTRGVPSEYGVGAPMSDLWDPLENLDQELSQEAPQGPVLFLAGSCPRTGIRAPTSTPMDASGAGNNDAANAERLAEYLNEIFPSMLDDEIALGTFAEQQDLLDDPMEVEEASDLGNATVEIPHELFTTLGAIRSTDDQAEACEDNSDGNGEVLEDSPTASFKWLVALMMAQLRAKSRKVKDCTHKIEALEKKLERAKAYGIRMKKAHDDLLRELEDSVKNQASQDSAKLPHPHIPLASPCSAIKPQSTLKAPRRTRFATPADVQASGGKQQHIETREQAPDDASVHQGPALPDLPLGEELPSKNDSNSHGAAPQASIQKPPAAQHTPCASTYADLQGGPQVLDCQAQSVGSRPAKPVLQAKGPTPAEHPKSTQTTNDIQQVPAMTPASAPLPSLASNSVSVAEVVVTVAVLQATPSESVRVGLLVTPGLTSSCLQGTPPQTVAADLSGRAKPADAVECPPTVKAETDPRASRTFEACESEPNSMAVPIQDAIENARGTPSASPIPAADLAGCQLLPEQLMEGIQQSDSDIVFATDKLPDAPVSLETKENCQTSTHGKPSTPAAGEDGEGSEPRNAPAVIMEPLDPEMQEAVTAQPAKDGEDDLMEEDICYTCGAADEGDVLVLCDGCDNACHLQCAQPPLRRVPKGRWYCGPCKAAMDGSNDKKTKSRRITSCAAKPPTSEDAMTNKNMQKRTRGCSDAKDTSPVKQSKRKRREIELAAATIDHLATVDPKGPEQMVPKRSTRRGGEPAQSVKKETAVTPFGHKVVESPPVHRTRQSKATLRMRNSQDDGKESKEMQKDKNLRKEVPNIVSTRRNTRNRH